VCAVGGRESIIDVDITVRCQGLGKLRIVLFLALVVAGVFQEQNATIRQRCDSVCCCRSDAVIGEGDRLSEQIGDSRSNRRERHLRHALPLRAAEMGEQNNLRAFFG